MRTFMSAMGDRPPLDDRPFRTSGNMMFGDALLAVQNGLAISRSGWNGKGLFVVLMPELQLAAFSQADEMRRVNDRTARWIGVDTPLDCRPYFTIYDPATNKWQPGWVPSTADCLATDWCVMEPVVPEGTLLDVKV